MKKLEVKIDIDELNYSELNSQEQNLVQKSDEAKKLSYSPYSNFKVGCAIELEDGTLIQAANQENAAYPICLCAESNALAVVSSQYPTQKIKMVSISIDGDVPASPCGQCRQSFSEYEYRMKKPFIYLLKGSEKIYRFLGINNLLPLAFNEGDLK